MCCMAVYDCYMEKSYYLSFTEYCQKIFGRKLYRTALNAGMTCPNRDGTLGSRGCIFCDAGGSGDFAIPYHGQKLTEDDLKYNRIKAGAGNYIAYFQSYTNTYASPEKLEMLFASALQDPLFAGISIATRPDCMQEKVLQILSRLKQTYPNKFIWVELGLQSINEHSALWMRRGYALPVFTDCVHRLHTLGIPVIAHVIIGLPSETDSSIYATIAYLNQQNIEGVKLQLLHYLKDCDLGKMYEENPESFSVLSEEKYTDIIVHCIGLLDPSTVIHRLTGDGNRDLLLAPLWSLDKRHVLNAIHKKLKEKGIVQGCLSGTL